MSHRSRFDARVRWLALAALATVLSAAATATEYCGANGTVKLSFVQPQPLQPTLTVTPEASGATVVDVWAVLDDVAEVEGPGGVLLMLGGFEFTLRVTGAEATVLAKQIAIPYRDFGANLAECRVGTYPGEPVTEGPLPLVHWQVSLEGELRDVVFDLAPGGAPSCGDLAPCQAGGCRAVYVGSVDAGQQNYLFGAAFQAAVLNPGESPDLAPVACGPSVAEVGIFTPREPHEAPGQPEGPGFH